MYWIILISFLSLFAISFVVSRPGNKLIKNKKNKTHLLDVLSSYMGGFLLVIIVYLFVSASNGKEHLILVLIFLMLIDGILQVVWVMQDQF